MQTGYSVPIMGAPYGPLLAAIDGRLERNRGNAA
jgi:hypothetical protein